MYFSKVFKKVLEGGGNGYESPRRMGSHWAWRSLHGDRVYRIGGLGGLVESCALGLQACDGFLSVLRLLVSESSIRMSGASL